MTAADVFSHAGTFVMLGWIVLILGPRRFVWLNALPMWVIPLGLSAFITALQPIMTGALSARMTGERVTPQEWAGLILGLAAVAIVIGDGIALGGSVVAHILPFLAVIAITVASLIDRSATVSNENAAPLLLVTFWHCVASLIVLAPLAVGLEGLQANWNGSLVFAVVWLALVVSLAAYGMMFVLLRKLPAPRVASLTYLSPPVTMVMAWLVFGETLTLTGVIGLGIAALAVALTLSARRSTERGQEVTYRDHDVVAAAE